jgi:hypothetical protein
MLHGGSRSCRASEWRGDQLRDARGAAERRRDVIAGRAFLEQIGFRLVFTKAALLLRSAGNGLSVLHGTDSIQFGEPLTSNRMSRGV